MEAFYLVSISFTIFYLLLHRTHALVLLFCHLSSQLTLASTGGASLAANYGNKTIVIIQFVVQFVSMFCITYYISKSSTSHIIMYVYIYI